MGFGLVFLGYLFMFSIPFREFDIAIDLLGFVLAYFGVKKLAEYGCGFDNLKKYFCVILPSSAITLIFQLASNFGLKSNLFSFWNPVYIALVFVYNLMLLVSIYKIAEDIELMSLKAKARRNLLIGVIYYFFTLLFNIPLDVIEKFNKYLSQKLPIGLILYLLGYVWLFLNLGLIYSCYMRICEPGDEDMPIKEKKSILKGEED